MMMNDEKLIISVYSGLTYYLGLILVFEERFGENVDEFGQMLKVFGHFGSEHHVDDALPHHLVTLPVQA